MTSYRVLYFSPVKEWVRLKVICVSEEFSLNSKPWFSPGGGLHETLSIGKVKLGPIQFTFSTGAASAHSKTHPRKYYLTFIWIKTFKKISNELHQTKEFHDYCISIFKGDMSVRAGKLHNYTTQDIATQRWRLQMAFSNSSALKPCITVYSVCTNLCMLAATQLLLLCCQKCCSAHWCYSVLKESDCVKSCCHLWWLCFSFPSHCTLLQHILGPLPLLPK